MTTPAPARRPRSWCLYAVVIARSKDMFIARLPEYAMPWRTVMRELGRVLREHGVRMKDVWQLDGFAGYPPHPRRLSKADREWLDRGIDFEAQARTVARCEAAFAGDPEPFREFWLYAWDEAQQKFVLARKGDPPPKPEVAVVNRPWSLFEPLDRPE